MKTIAITKIEEVENTNNHRLWRSIENRASGALAKAAARINSACSQFKEYGKEHAIMKSVFAIALAAVILSLPTITVAAPVVFEASGQARPISKPQLMASGLSWEILILTCLAHSPMAAGRSTGMACPMPSQPRIISQPTSLTPIPRAAPSSSPQGRVSR